MRLAKFGDKLVIEVLGTNPGGVPDAIRIENLRDGHPIESHPAFTGNSRANLRAGALKLISQWWWGQAWTTLLKS